MMASSSSNRDDSREPCQYGSSCYRKNKDHLEKFKHPGAKVRETRTSTKTVDRGSLKQQKLNVFFKRNDQKAIEVKKNDQKTTEAERNDQQVAEVERNDQQVAEVKRNDQQVAEVKRTDQKAAEVQRNVQKTFEVKRKRLESDENEEEIEQPSCSSETTSVDQSKPVFKIPDPKDAVSSNQDRLETPPEPSEIQRTECDRIIKKLFLINMPDDFYDFWEFCKSLSPKNPQDALDSIDLQLVGPYDVIMGLVDESLDQSTALRHWRYFYDPPEFQTVIRSTQANSFHIGYFRDEPDKLPEFVASNFAAKNATITPVGENLFAAVDWCVRESEKTATPFKKVKSSNFKTELHQWAKQNNYNLNSSTEKIRSRDRKIVARTFHHAGIVVPYDKKTELGYRPLAETASNLTKLLKQIDNSKGDDERKIYFSKLYEIVTWATIAMDEGDYGTCLELGLDLFSFGSHHLHKIILQLLPSAYNLLNRQPFSTILKAHLDDRKKGNALSALTR